MPLWCHTLDAPLTCPYLPTMEDAMTGSLFDEPDDYRPDDEGARAGVRRRRMKEQDPESEREALACACGGENGRHSVHCEEDCP